MIIDKQDDIIADADCVDRETSGLYGSKVVVVDDWTQASRRTLTVLIRLQTGDGYRETRASQRVI